MNNVLHETKIHGKLFFPYTVYRVIIPEYIHSYPVHWHKEMELIYVVSGEGYVMVQTEQYHVQQGDIIVIPPEALHSIKQFQSECMEYYNIIFDFNLLENHHSHCYEKYLKDIEEHSKKLPFYIRKQQELSSLLTPYLQNLIDNRHQRYSTDELLIKSDLYAILHFLIQYSSEYDDDESRIQSNYIKIKKVIYYVQENYADKITIDNAASLIHYSASYFSKIFHQLTGTSFTQYLKDYRLEIAADKLINTEKSVTEIAAETGFCNLPYFTRSFQKKYGVSPNQFKKHSSS